jgi:uncharacterized protein (DUF2147 family)
MGKSFDLSGKWRSRHSYPTQDDSGEETSQYELTARQKGDEVVFESLADKSKDGSYMVIRLKVDDNLATGTWHETTEEHGVYKHMTYSGAGQMMIDEKGNMRGMWAGAGIDRKADKPKIYTGRWDIMRLA